MGAYSPASEGVLLCFFSGFAVCGFCRFGIFCGVFGGFEAGASVPSSPVEGASSAVPVCSAASVGGCASVPAGGAGGTS